MTGPCLALFIDQADFKAEIESLGVDDHVDWVARNADATTHFLECANQTICIVCVRPEPEREALETITLIVHEAVHVWQRAMEDIAERHPSDEFEAYSIQAISHILIAEYIRQLELKDPCKKTPSRRH